MGRIGFETQGEGGSKTEIKSSSKAKWINYLLLIVSSPWYLMSCNISTENWLRCKVRGRAHSEHTFGVYLRTPVKCDV